MMIGIVSSSVITENSIILLPTDYLGDPVVEDRALKNAKIQIKRARTALKTAKLEKRKGTALRKKYKVRIIR